MDTRVFGNRQPACDKSFESLDPAALVSHIESWLGEMPAEDDMVLFGDCKTVLYSDWKLCMVVCSGNFTSNTRGCCPEEVLVIAGAWDTACADTCEVSLGEVMECGVWGPLFQG